MKVIVNADDLGVHTSIDEGIFQAFDKGIVTSASLLAVGANVEEAARVAVAAGLPVGLHLSLSEGKPLRMRRGYLVGEDGRFDRSALDIILRYNPLAEGDAELQGLRAEIDSQFQYLADLGVNLTHVDTHQHVHLNKYVSEAIASAAAKFGVTRMRCCREPLFFSMLGVELFENARRLNIAKWLLARLITSRRGTPLTSTDAYFGLNFSGNMSSRVITRFFESIDGDATWEVASHPGVPIPPAEVGAGYAPFYGSPHRLKELQALCEPEVQDIVARRGIELVSWASV